MKNHILLVLSLLFLSACKTQPTPAPADASAFTYAEIDITAIHAAYAKGELNAESLTQAYLDRIAAIDHSGPELRSVIALNPDALNIARELDAEWKAGKKRGPMHGIPVLLKDNIDTHDQMPTTAGSRALAGSMPLQDSYLAQKLREAGAIILGKTNLSEWANFRGELSSSGWSGIGGQTLNPYDLTRNPCGSSSGSGVSVSANLTVLAIGTETNGSIVCPSNNNGIVGIKPTVGLISRSGVIPISYTQDTPGPMARTVRDAAICLGALTGVDSADAKTLASAGHLLSDYTPFLKADGLKGKRIGFYTGANGTHNGVDALMKNAVDYLRAQGAEIIEIDNILAPGTDNQSFEVMLYEYKDGLNHYFQSLGPKAKIKSLEDLIAFNLQDSVELDFYDQRYLEIANKKGPLTEQGYLDALEKARAGSQDLGIDRVMNLHRLDAIVAPTGSPAWKTDHVNGDHFLLGSSSPAAISGYPSITVPMGWVEGLPVGISFFGRAWSEPLLIEIAYGYEQGTKWRKAPGL